MLTPPRAAGRAVPTDDACVTEAAAGNRRGCSTQSGRHSRPAGAPSPAPPWRRSAKPHSASRPRKAVHPDFRIVGLTGIPDHCFRVSRGSSEKLNAPGF